MAQHFLLSAAARTLSLVKVMRMSDAEALDAFKAIRWANNGGKPFCPKCGCVAIYTYAARQIFKCKGCQAQFIDAAHARQAPNAEERGPVTKDPHPNAVNFPLDLDIEV